MRSNRVDDLRLDVHQHIWTAPLLARLRARETLPLVRVSDGLTVVHSAAEQPYVIDVASRAPERRATLARRDGLDRVLIAISSPVGIEALPRDSALELIDAHLDGVASLPPEFAAWGPIALDDADADQVDALLSRGCIGISLPAEALTGPDRLHNMCLVLERAAARGVPLFVHPGLGPGRGASDTWFGEPLWWRALTVYVAQMQAAWLTFASFGRREHPELIVIFAMLAGGAPLIAERLVSRGGPPIDLPDPRVFYEVSSYGPDAVAMMARQVGWSQLLYGSDRPVIDPTPTGYERSLQRTAGALFEELAVAA